MTLIVPGQKQASLLGIPLAHVPLVPTSIPALEVCTKELYVACCVAGAVFHYVKESVPMVPPMARQLVVLARKQTGAAMFLSEQGRVYITDKVEQDKSGVFSYLVRMVGETDDLVGLAPEGLVEYLGTNFTTLSLTLRELHTDLSNLTVQCTLIHRAGFRAIETQLEHA